MIKKMEEKEKKENKKCKNDIKNIEKNKKSKLILEKSEDKKNKKNIEINKDIEYLKSKISSYKKKQKDLLLRSQAELQNIKRRYEQDIEKIYKFSLEKFSIELLPVVDNLERSIENSKNNTINFKILVDGVQLTLKSMLSVMNKFGIQKIDQVNVAFDPSIHQAIKVVYSDKYNSNIVIKIIQNGYFLNKRLIRPAMVFVSKNKK